MTEILDITGKQFADRKKVHPGAVVVLKGIIRGIALPALVVRVHPTDVEMTDATGELVRWNGSMPVIDAIFVDKIITKSMDEITVIGGKVSDFVDPLNGEPKRVERIPWAQDIERRSSWQRLPPMIVEASPRYVIIGELHGK